MKKAITIILALLFILSLAACGQTATTDVTADDTTPALTAEPTTTEATTEPEQNWNITSVDKTQTQLFDDNSSFESIEINGMRVKTDEEGLCLMDAKTNREIFAAEGFFLTYAFDGETLLYLCDREDPTVDFDKDYVISYEEEPIKPSAYYVGDVMQYDIASGKTEKLFTEYNSSGRILYFNDKDVFYLDILESQIGYKNDYDSLDVKLYRYDRTTGERELLSDENSIEATGIYTKDSAYIMDRGKVYDTAKHEWLKEEISGEYQWTYGDHFYCVLVGYPESENEETEESMLEGTIFDYNLKEGTSKILYEYTVPEDMRYVSTEFKGRYVPCGADITKDQKNEYTVSYGATKLKLYDLLLKKTIEIDPNEYDAMEFVNSVMVTWIHDGEGTYQISYYDDDGNHVYYDTWKVKGLLDTITADGYYVETGETDDGEGILSFVSKPLEFLQTK